MKYAFDQINREKKMSMMSFLMIFHHPLNSYFLTSSIYGMTYVTVLLHRSVKNYTFIAFATTVYQSVV